MEEDHIGHELYISICSRDNGGVCDCGDAEAWVIQNHCKHHKTGETPDEDIPESLKSAMLETLECVFDYVIDVMSTSTPSFVPMSNKTTIFDHSNSSSLNATKYGGVDENSSKYYLILYNDQSKHFSDAVSRIKLASFKVTEFAEMVAKQVHKNGRGIVLGSESLDFLLQRKSILESTGLYSCIRSYRDVFREEMCLDIVRWLDDITKGPIYGNYKLVHKLLCRALCCKWDPGVDPSDDMLNHYLPGRLQLNKIPIVPSYSNQVLDSEKIDYWNTDISIDKRLQKWDISQELCEACDYDASLSSTNLAPVHGSRFQYLLLFDIRLWKNLRVLLHEIYVSVAVSNISYKDLMACQYADMYPVIAEIYLLLDREPDWNFMGNLSVQLFTCPTNATLLSGHGELKKILSLAYGYLTLGHVILPQFLTLKFPLQLSSLKVRRWNQLFFDMSYILQRNEDAQLFFEKDFVLQVIDLVILFNGLPVIKRESVEHVEYETNDYPLYFNGVSIIANFCKLIAKSASKLQHRKSVVGPAIYLVLQRFSDMINMRYYEPMSAKKLQDKTDLRMVNDFKEVDILGIKQTVLNFRVDKDVVSFLHPLSTFLSYLIEESGIEDPKEISELISLVNTPGAAQEQSACIDNNNKNIWKIICDYSLRTVVLLSQIKVGFWVRNGYSVRSQYHNYRNLGLREYGFARDIFMIQMFSAIEDANTTTATILDRWGLIQWANEDYSNVSMYDSQTLHFMVEECLNFFIIFLEANDHLLGLADDAINERKLRNDIIHYLCFKPLTYTELCAELPDHVSNDRRFEYILNKLADYSLPPQSTINGRYKLKEEYFDQINPYYIHYTSNKREDAEKLVKERLVKNKGISFSDAYYEPKKIEQISLYKNFSRFTTSLFFIQFLKSTLNFILREKSDSLDGMINLILHLIHICVRSNFKSPEDSFSNLCFTELDVANSDSPVEYQSISSLLYLVLISENHGSHHSKIRAIFNDLKTNFPLRDQYLNQRFENFNNVALDSELKPGCKASEYERKKKLAAERKAKILASFKKQQSKFVEQNNVADDIVSDTEIEELSDTSWKFPEECCILCQMPGDEGDLFGTLAYVSDSSEFRNIPLDSKYWLFKAFSDDASLDKATSDDVHLNHHYHRHYHLQHKNDIKIDTEPTKPKTRCESYIDNVEKDSVIGPGFPNHDPCSVMSYAVTTSCGHGMHLSCFKNHLISMRKRLSHFTRTLPEDLANKEFICPLCKAVNNVLVPVLSHSNNISLGKYLKPGVSNWYTPFENFNKNSTSKWLSNYENVVYEELKQNSLQSLSSNYKSLFFGHDAASKIFEDSFIGLDQVLSYITLSYFKENLSSLLAHTIESVEISLRNIPHEVIGPNLVIYQLSHQVITTLRVWSDYKKYLITLNAKRSTVGSPSMFEESSEVIEHYLGILKLLSSKEIFNIGNIDFFELLVAAIPLNSYKFSFNSILTMCFLGEILKNTFVLVSKVFLNPLFTTCEQITLLDLPVVDNISEEARQDAKLIFDTMRQCVANSDTVSKQFVDHPKFGEVFYSVLLKCIVPFLRQSAIWAFVNAADDSEIVSEYPECCNEADKLCKFLMIPSFATMLHRFVDPTTFEGQKFKGFVERMKLYSYLNVLTRSNLQIKYPSKIELINLPARMDHFFTKYFYPRSDNDVSYDPAICLFCSKVIHLQESVISFDKGECNLHCETECINDCGLFLLPKHGSILVMYKGNGSFYDAPYYDQHGELPKDPRHGHPLHLNLQKYHEFIRNVWLQHNIPNFATRKLESAIDIGGWETL